MTAPNPNDARSTGEPTGGLIAEVLAGLSRLVRGEIDLAKAEAAQALQSVLRGAAFALAAVALVAVGLGLLVQSAVAALIAAGLSPAVASIAMAAVCLIAAYALVRLAIGHISRAGRFPDRSARNLTRDLQSFKAGVSSDVP